MRALVQRVTSASVAVDGETVGETGVGLLVFVCAMQGDSEQEADWMAGKIARLRIFRDDQGRMNRSVSDVGGGALVVSQFTLAAETKGNRPGFSRAAEPQLAQRLYERVCAMLASQGLPVGRGVFGADMKVRLVNDGPVTIWIDTATPNG